MYQERSHSPIEGLPISRPRPPRIFTRENIDHEEGGIAAGVAFSEDDSSDLDQKVSQQLLHFPDSDLTLVQSAPNPEHDVLPFDDLPNLSMSPAAMFLSAFSSPSPSLSELPDTEGAQVDGYTLAPSIGSGGFSTIRSANSSSGDVVAVKIVRRADLAKTASPEQARKRLDTEEAIWSALSHEHILPLFHVFHSPTADYFFMLYCPAGTLFDILQRDGTPALPHDDAGMMFRQVTRGVRYLHEQAQLVHGDLKLENVLVDEAGICRIADFGMARQINSHHERTPVRRQRSTISENKRVFPKGRSSLKSALPMHLSLLRHHSGPRHRASSLLPAAAQSVKALVDLPPGSLPYAAPELLRPPSQSHPYRPDPAQDIWALGVMLYALLTGRLPFMDSFEPRLTMKILHGAYDMPSDIGRGAELVLRGCLEYNVSQRWTIAAVDEVGWSVGWGDDSPAEQEIERMVDEAHRSPSCSTRSSTSCSRSRSRAPHAIPERDDILASPITRSSTSPGRFSLSRSRSPRRPSIPMATPILTPSSSTSSAYPPIWSSSPPRGRDPTKSHTHTSSRSPSPSVPPTTPIDTKAGDRYSPFVIGDDYRGRATLRPRSIERASPYPRSGSKDSEQHLPVPRWTLSPDPTDAGRSLSRTGLAPPQPEKTLQPEVGKRAGSQPPANSAPWTMHRVKPSVGTSSAVSVAVSTPGADGQFVLQSGTTTPRVRSKSVVGHRDEWRWPC
ncbi:kinase-like domain-containing protein [Amylostereum chailletii]|nr:kinase-like domain-containing protein [Amylostereum chailletii]